MSKPRSLSDSPPASASFRYANTWPRMRHRAGAGSPFDNTDDHPADDDSPTDVPSPSQENAATPSHNRGRARTLQLTPRKRRISTIQREATRMRSDSPEREISSNIAIASPSPSIPSEASSPLRLLANASSSDTTSLEANSTLQTHPDPPSPGENLSGGDVPEYPEWLRDFLQEGGERPAVALAYQLPSSGSEAAHTTYIPLRGLYKFTHWSASMSTVKSFGYIATRDGSSFTILEQGGKKSNKESWFSRIRNQSAKIFSGRRWGTSSNRKAAADPVSVVSPKASQDVPRPVLDANRIAVEIWENIMQHLPRDDWKNLRLVNKAVERNTSGTVFRTVVVPFTADIYGMMYDSMATNTENPSNWAPKTGALDIFGGFGQHIKNFGMRFEVDQVSLSNPPVKVLQQGHESYWGTYDWPFPQYTRFQDRADLEVTADETSAMKEAFSQLNNVLHMALSLDCGLGWLSGPDMSIRARVLSHPDTIFEHSLGAHGGLSAQQQLWTLLEKTFELSGVTNLMYEELVRRDVPNLAELRRMIQGRQSIRTNSRIVLEANLIDELPKCKQLGDGARQSGPRIGAREEYGVEGGPEWEALRSQVNDDNGRPDSPRSSSYAAAALRHLDAIDLLRASAGSNPSSTNKTVPEVGLLYTRPMTWDVVRLTQSSPFFAPKNLTKEQKEWLLESAWAQDAFLSSYILAITDNAGSFQNVRNLTIKKLSSRHLPKLCRNDFWDSLPCLKCVDLRVIADLRDVLKDEAGQVDTTSIRPSDAIAPFNQLLSGFISTQPSIVSLCIGWADGGEHAEGMFARNQQILPAPLTQKPLNTDERTWRSHLLRLPHVKKLTLANCWITPNALSAFLTPGIFAPALEHLKFDSVSLTEHPKFEYRAPNLNQLNQHHHHNNNNNNNNNNNIHGVAVLGQHPLVPPANHNHNQNIHGMVNAVPGQPWNPQAAHLQNPVQVNQAVAILQQHAHGNAVPLGNFIHTLNQALATVQQMHGFQVALAVAWGLPLPQQAGVANTLPIREGSWTNVLHETAQSRELVKTRGELRFSFLSCGYARLRGAFFDQTGMDEAEAAYNLMYQVLGKQASFFNNRRGILTDLVMTSHDSLQGHIVYGRTAFEIETLRGEFGLEQGWPNSDNMGEEAWVELDEGEWGKWGEKNKVAAEYDGAREGGTGRFSGVIVYHEHTEDEELD